MASGNSWQVFQELDSAENLAEAQQTIVQVLTKETSPTPCQFNFEVKGQQPERKITEQSTNDEIALKLIGILSNAADTRREPSGGRDTDSNKSESGSGKRSHNSHEQEFFDAESELNAPRQGTVRFTKNLLLKKAATFADTGSGPTELKPEHLIDPNCPIHGVRKRGFSKTIFSRSKKLEDLDQLGLGMTASTGRIQASPSIEMMSSRGVSPFNALTLAVEPFTKSELALKMARRQKLSILSAEVREKVKIEKYKIGRNLFVVSVAFLFVVSAFQGLQNLQLSVNSERNLGAISLTTVYTGSVISCMFLPPYLLNRLGCKLTLVVCMSVYSLFMLINFVPEFYTMIPGSLFLGLAAAPLWAAKCTYLTETGFRYAALNLEPPNVVIVRFFGIFFMIVHMGQVFGNLISSTILKLNASVNTLGPVFDGVETSCGHMFNAGTNLSARVAERMTRPDPPIMLSLYGAYFCCTLVAIMVVFMFVDQLHMDTLLVREKPRFKLDMWNKTLHHMKQPRHLFIIPLTIFNGLEQSFIAGEFTKSYVACCLGIHKVGFVMTSFGAADAVCSLFFGPLIKLFGRMPLLMFAAVVDMLMIFTLLIWPPNPADTAIFYVIAAAWGMADAVWNTQINGVWAVLFTKNLEVAFANYRLWESFGFILGFTTTNVNIHIKLYLLLTCLLFGMIGYGLIELWEPLEVHTIKIKRKVARLRSDRSKFVPSQITTIVDDNLAASQTVSSKGILTEDREK